MIFFKKEKYGAKRILTILGKKLVYYKGLSRYPSVDNETQLIENTDGSFNARELFLRQRRFDLSIKYTYLDKNSRYGDKTNFFTHLYVEHIRAFAGFYEDESDYPEPKASADDFIRVFQNLGDAIVKHGFDPQRSTIPVDENFALHNGAHRLAACAWAGGDVFVTRLRDSVASDYGYKHFLKKGLEVDLADFNALSDVCLNPDAYIVNLHAVTDSSKDTQVEAVLEKYGFVFYKKEISMNLNGYVNLKKLSYGKDNWVGNTWIGGVEDDFSQAREHAERSIGSNPMRVYVFVSPHLDKVIQAKKEIRNIFGIGNYSIHINDNHEEAKELAQTYFNQNSLEMLKARPYSNVPEKLDSFIDELKKHCRQNEIDLDEICGVGSTPLAVLGLRECKDFDFLCCAKKNLPDKGKHLSNHAKQLLHYPFNETEIIQNPACHFYYRGVKFITLDVLRQMKSKRGEEPKDVDDCRLIDAFFKGNPPTHRRKKHFKIFRKIKNGKTRTFELFGFIRFSYKQDIPKKRNVPDKK